MFMIYPVDQNGGLSKLGSKKPFIHDSKITQRNRLWNLQVNTPTEYTGLLPRNQRDQFPIAEFQPVTESVAHD